MAGFRRAAAGMWGMFAEEGFPVENCGVDFALVVSNLGAEWGFPPCINGAAHARPWTRLWLAGPPPQFARHGRDQGFESVRQIHAVPAWKASSSSDTTHWDNAIGGTS
jgi:hypothetical protein